jgi:hypothetical protein
MNAMYAAWTQLETEVAGIVGKQRAQEGAMAVWSCVHGLSMLRLDSKLPPHINPDEAVTTMIDILITGLNRQA